DDRHLVRTPELAVGEVADDRRGTVTVTARRRHWRTQGADRVAVVMDPSVLVRVDSVGCLGAPDRLFAVIAFQRVLSPAMMVSMASAALLGTSSSACRYIWVVDPWACRSVPCTVFRSTPAASRYEAQACRRSCSRTSGIPARSARRFQARLMFRGS